MKFTKKIVTLLIIAVLACSMLPVVQVAAEETCVHDYIWGICMNCFELDPDFRHPCLDGHDFDDVGACRNCSIYDSSFFDLCKDDAHDLDENGQCRECRYFEEVVKPEPDQQTTEPEGDSNSIDDSVLLVVIVLAGLLLTGDVVFVCLVLTRKKK